MILELGGTLQSTSNTKKAPVSKIIHGTQFQNLPSGLTPQRQRIVFFFIGFVNLDAPFSHLHTSLYIFDIVYGCTSKFEGKTNSQALGGPLSSAKVRVTAKRHSCWSLGHWVEFSDRKPGFASNTGVSAHFLWNQVWKCRNSGYLCGVEFHSFVINKYQQPVARVIQQQSKVLWCTSTASSHSSTRLRKKKRGPETNWQALCEVSEEFGCWVRNPFYKFTINIYKSYGNLLLFSGWHGDTCKSCNYWHLKSSRQDKRARSFQ